jgi:hypothetical protein
MTPEQGRPSRTEVLQAFAVEIAPGQSTLERYLRLFPEYAEQLVDLSRELDREVIDDTGPLSDGDRVLIDEAWSDYAAAVRLVATDPFAALTVDDWRGVATHLGVPRQVVTALRERRISLASIPRPFLERLAEAVRSSVAQLEATLTLSGFAAARSYKADTKPTARGGQITLEQVLIEAGVAPDRRAQLLASTD